MLHLVGTPSTKLQSKHAVLHHTLGDHGFSSYSSMAAHLSMATVLLHSADQAPDGIDRAIRVALQTSRPTYLTLPTDLVTAKVSSKSLQQRMTARECIASPSFEPASDKSLQHAVAAVVALYEKAQKPLVLIDACAVRFGVQQQALDLIEATRVPFVTSPMGKGAIDEAHPRFSGIYVGDISDPAVRDLVNGSDFVISVGGINSGALLLCDRADVETSTRAASAARSPRTTRWRCTATGPRCVTWTVSKSAPTYLGAIRALREPRLPSHAAGPDRSAWQGQERRQVDQVRLTRLPNPLTTQGRGLGSREGSVRVAAQGRRRSRAGLVLAASRLVPQGRRRHPRGDRHEPLRYPGHVAGSVGLADCADVKFPPNVTFIGQILYGSIGYTGGAVLGAAIAAKKAGRRAILCALRFAMRWLIPQASVTARCSSPFRRSARSSGTVSSQSLCVRRLCSDCPTCARAVTG